MPLETASAGRPTDVSVRFMVDADPSPGLLPRLLQPFAKRDLVPDRMWAHAGASVTHVELALHAVPAEIVGLIEGNLRQVVGVHNVVRVQQAILRQVA